MHWESIGRRLGAVREPLATFHSDGKAFKDDGKEQEHCIQSKVANQPCSHIYDIRIFVLYLQECDLNFDLEGHLESQT